MTTIHLVGGTDEFRDQLNKVGAMGAGAETVEVEVSGFDADVVQTLAESGTDLVVVGPGLGVDDSLKLIEALSEAAPHLSAILIAVPNTDLWPKAMRAGAKDIVTPVSSTATIREACERAIEVGRKLKESAPVIDLTAPVPPTGRVLTIISPKGGSGKTTVAANLAATIARSRPGDVVLADLDVQFGDIGHAYRLDPEYSLLNAVSPGVTPTMLKGFLTPHATKVLALTAPDRPEDADDIDAAAASATVRTLGELFEIVIVDTGAGLDDHTLAAVDAATDIVFVSATDVPSVRAVVKEYDILERLGMLQDRARHLVLNRADARVGLSTSDIEQTIGLEAAMTIPSTRTIPAALNLGEPVVVSDTRSPVARAFTDFAGTLGLIEPETSGTSRPWRKR